MLITPEHRNALLGPEIYAAGSKRSMRPKTTWKSAASSSPARVQAAQAVTFNGSWPTAVTAPSAGAASKAAQLD
jgi:hypothetical protein